MSTLLIQNGVIHDGTGRKGYRSNILVEDGMIRQIADIPMRAQRMIDAEGMAVTPGFIDIHRHCSVDSLRNGTCGNADLAQGITTVVVDELQKERVKHTWREKLPVNYCAVAGAEMAGLGEHPFSPANLERTRARIKETMQDGAKGITLGMIDIAKGSTQQIAKALEPVGEYHGLLTVHIRYKGNLDESVRRIIEIADMASCAAHISHFRSCNTHRWGKQIYRVISRIDAARYRGQDITCDFYPYERAAASLTAVIPPTYGGGDVDLALRHLGTAKGVEEFRSACALWYRGDGAGELASPDWKKIQIHGVSRERNQKFVGLSIAEAAEKFGFGDSAACAAHLLHTEGYRAEILNMCISRNDTHTVARLPYAIVISDSDDNSNGYSPHPRYYGAFPKIIREYVVERGIYTLEEAIHRMSGKPAHRMRLEKRGMLLEGYHADINVFDPNRFRDNASHIHPQRLSTGLSYCLVGGNVAVDHDVRINENFGIGIPAC